MARVKEMCVVADADKDDLKNKCRSAMGDVMITGTQTRMLPSLLIRETWDYRPEMCAWALGPSTLDLELIPGSQT